MGEWRNGEWAGMILRGKGFGGKEGIEERDVVGWSGWANAWTGRNEVRAGISGRESWRGEA